MRLLTLTLLFLIPSVCQSQELFSFANAQGSYGVGVRIVEQYDRSRSFPSTAAPGKHRPVQTVVWYPALKGGAPLVYDDYVNLIGSADDFTRPIEERRKLVEDDIAGKTDGKDGARIALARQQAMWAVPGAVAVSGRFPVVVYAPSISGDSFQNADLCEYLASHGYVVLASPSLGTDKRNQSLKLADIESQAADIRFLIDYASSLEHADTSRLAVMGYSIGGLSSVFAAAQDKRITALVQLDGSVRYFNKLLTQAGYVTPDRVTIPMLYLAHRPLHDAVENLVKYKQDVSGSFINEMQGSDLYLFNINALDHRDFSSWFIRIRDAASFEDYSVAEVSAAYGWVASYVLQFLNAYTKADPAATRFLLVKPEANRVPRHLIEKVIQRQQ